LLGVSVQSLKVWRKRGMFPDPSHRIPGGRAYYAEQDVPELLEVLCERNKLLSQTQMAESCEVAYHNFNGWVAEGKVSPPTISRGGRKRFYSISDIANIKEEITYFP